VRESQTIEIDRKKVGTYFEQKQNPNNDLKTNEIEKEQERNVTERDEKTEMNEPNNMDGKRT
jgi:hypothetical protein